MGKKTPLYDCHVQAGAKIVDFAGWDMPLHYGSQLQEHHKVRNESGIFDVSHMTVVDIQGKDAAPFLRYLLANNVDRLVAGKALYSCMLNDIGGVIDDLIVYKLSDDNFRLIVNSATREKDLNWVKQHAGKFAINIHEREDVAMVALQGPKVRDKISSIFSNAELKKILELKPFFCTQLDGWFVGRTGYTGEDGFEVILPAKEASEFWKKAVSTTISPCGLGARDTLRLEAGLNLYGADMDETVTPLESNLAWTVSFEPKDRNFIGRAALEAQMQQGVKRKLVGLILEGQGVLRNHQTVLVDKVGDGEVTSGSFSPTLNKSIALARVPAETGASCLVNIRNKHISAQVVKPPFVHKKKVNE